MGWPDLFTRDVASFSKAGFLARSPFDPAAFPTGGRNLPRPGKKASAAFPSSVAFRYAEGMLEHTATGTAPVFHRLPFY